MMRWVKVGRHTIDLRRVYRLTEGGEDSSPSVTICFVGGQDLDLAGAEATDFLLVFGRFIATRSFGLPPPERDGAGGEVVVPQYYEESAPGPVEPPGVEGGGVLRPNAAGDHQ